jgi:hypothetical protein
MGGPTACRRCGTGRIHPHTAYTTHGLHHTRPSARIPRPSYRAYLPTTVSVSMQRVAMELMRGLAGSCCLAVTCSCGSASAAQIHVVKTKAKDIAGD